MPGCDSGSYSALLALTVYVSGASEMNEKAPDASEVLCPVCDGDVTLTTAPAIGACVAASTTRPRSVPVVPARAPQGIATATTRTSPTISFPILKKSAFKLAEYNFLALP